MPGIYFTAYGNNHFNYRMVLSVKFVKGINGQNE